MQAAVDTSMTLLFSSQGGSQPTPSAQLGAGLKNMSLSSQSAPSQSGGPPGTGMERPPVPLFSEGPQVASQQLPLPPAALPAPLEIPSLSQQDFLGTQDFITPVDQFGLDYDPKDAKRSPARLSPDRVKRPRQGGSDVSMEEVGEPPSEPRGGWAGPSGRGGAWGGGAGRSRPIARVQSPPCYRNIHADGDSEDDYAVWKAPRPQQQALSRYRQDFKEVGLLGQGNFSKVFRARDRFTGREYAVKRTHHAVRPDCPAFGKFIQEAQVMAHLPPHPNVVQFYHCWSEPAGAGEGEHLYMRLEKCDVSLGIHASLGEQLREADLLEVLRQMACALAHLHRHGVAHMDVKPDNIYLQDLPEGEAADGLPASSSSSGGSGVAVRYKLGDFGQATLLNLRTPLAVDEGDCRYMPLEVLQGDLRQLAKADMFALGATLLELATRSELPAGGQQYQDLRAGRLPLLPTFSQSLAKMIRSLMSPKPEDRPSAEKVLQSALLCKAAASSPPALQPLVHQASTASTQSAAMLDTGAATAAPPAAAAGGGKQFAGLVLQPSTAK